MNKEFTSEFKISLELEGEKRLSGNDLFNMLENIQRYGSISRAASELGISYRYAWGLLGSAEKALGLELINRQVGGYAGGGASLSEEGRGLLNEYKVFKEEVDTQLQYFINRAAASAGQRLSVGEIDHKQSVTERHLLLASTMEPVESGLLDVLEKAFFQETGVLLRHIALGSGRALEIARKGRVDMVLAHAPELEEEFMLSGWGQQRLPVMSNEFVLAGPTHDPVQLKALGYGSDVQKSFRQIARKQAPFISRGDRSGTHLRELQIWDAAGITPGGKWYIISSGIIGNMGILRLALEKGAYAFVDRGTFLLSHSHQKMNILSEAAGDHVSPGVLENIFSLILVNSQRVPAVNSADALLFAGWLQGKEAERIIFGFGEKKFGRPLFSKIKPT